MTKPELIQYINTYINTNGVRSITGAELNVALIEMLNQSSTSIGSKIRFTPTEPPTPSLDDMWIDSDTDNIYMWNGVSWELAIDIQALIVHTLNKTNPHEVTKTQVGLGNVTNDAQIPLIQKGASNGVATLDALGKVPVSQLPSSIMEYKGTWNATTNIPTLADGIGDSGDVYVVSVAGIQTFGGITYNFDVRDNLMYNGTIWQKSSGSTSQKYLSAGMYVLPTLTNNGGGSVTIGTGEVILYNNSVHTGILDKYNVSAITVTLTDNSTNYIVADYNSGSVILRNTLNVLEINESNIVPVYTIVRIGATLHTLNWDTLGKGLSNKLHQSIVKTQRFRRESGLMLSESTNRTVNLTSGIVWYGATNISLDIFVSTSNSLYFYSKTGGVWTNSIVTTYNNTLYQNGANTATLTNNRYAVNWIFRGVESDTECYMVLGTGDYTISEAIASQPPSDIPFEITSHAILVGRIIVLKAAETAAQIDSAFVQSFTSGSTNDHANLANLQGGTSGEYFHLNNQEHQNILFPSRKDYGFVVTDPDIKKVLSFNEGTGVFSVTGNLDYYRQGKFNAIGTTTKTITLPIVTLGDYFIYFDNDTATLEYSTTAWTLNDTKIPVAIVLFRITPSRSIVLYECHTAEFTRQEHRYLHQTQNTKLITGGIISGQTLNGSIDTENCYGLTQCTIADEDLRSTLNIFAKGNGTGTEYTNLYRSGTTFTWDENQPVPLKYTTTGYIEYDNSGTPTAATNNRFVNTFVISIPTDGTTKERFMNVLGQNVFTSSTLAYAETWDTIIKTGFPFMEFVVLYQLTWETQSSLSTKGKCRLNRVAKVTGNAISTTGSQGHTQNTDYQIISPDSTKSVVVTNIETTVTGDQTTTGQIKSTLAIGNSPLAVTSTTVCTNLNADKVDGYDIQSNIYDTTGILRVGSFGIGNTAVTLTTASQTELDDYTFGANGAMYRVVSPTGLLAGTYVLTINRVQTLQIHQTLRSTNLRTLVYQRWLSDTSGVTAWSSVWDSTNSNLSTIDWTTKNLTANGIFKVSTAQPYIILEDTTAAESDAYIACNVNKFYINFDSASIVGAKFVIDSTTGNTGIGTNAPNEKLEVFGNVKVTNGQLISTIAGGTSPLLITSTTKVANLNVDRLDDKEAADFYNYKGAATGIPSTTGAGNVDFANATDYFSATTFTGNVTWTMTNIANDRVIAVDCIPSTFSITLAGTGITFLGAVNSAKVIQGLDTTKANLISFWAESTTRVWVNVIKNQA